MNIDSFELIDIDEKNFSVNSDKAILANRKIILNEGNYKLSLLLETSKENQGDFIGIYLGDKLFRIIDIPVGLKELVEVNLTLEVTEVAELYFINESDDFLKLNIVNGGLYMSEPLQIINVSNFNPFSFDLELNAPFTNEMIVKVNEIGATVADLTPVPVQVVNKLNLKEPLNSTEMNPSLKTVIYDETGLTTPEYFKFNTDYKVEVFNGVEIASGIYQFTTSTFPMMNESNCTVKSFGTRILAIEFDYPVQNMEATIQLGTTDVDKVIELNNLYISYDNKDVPVTDNNEKWLGNIELQKPYVYTPPTGGAINYVTYPFAMVASPDKRRFTIQFNTGNFNTGSINKLTINYNISPEYDPALRIRDFANRMIASFAKEFICVRETSPADIIPSEITALSNHELMVTFDNPVCSWLPEDAGTDPLVTYLDLFKQYNYFQLFNVTTGGETPFTVNSVDWVGNGYSTLLYTLDYTAANIMPVPQATVRVGKVVDASGLDTFPATATINVPPTEPKFIDAYQKKPSAVQTNTEVVIVFNEKMTTGIGANSAENKLNYMFMDPNGNTIDLTAPGVTLAVIPGTDDKQFLLTIPQVLSSGIYNLTAYDTIEDFTGVNILADTKPIQILDYVSPAVEKIIATRPIAGNTDMTVEDNGMIIMFDREMNVASTSPHSAVDGDNYLMMYTDATTDDSTYILDDTAILDNIYGDRWIRTIFPVDQNLPVFELTGTPDANKIHIGYVQGQQVYYVTSKSGNIYPLCTIQEIDEFVDKLTIAAPAATSEVTNDNQITVTINNPVGSYVNNMFGTMDATDFAASIDGGTTFDKIPLSITTPVYPFDTITLTFAPDTFSSSQDIRLKVVAATPRSKDIFGKPIVPNAESTVVNNIPTALRSISLIDVNQGASSALVELLFEKSVSNYKVTDFNMVYKNNGASIPLTESASGTPVPSIGAPRPNTVQIQTTLPVINDEVLKNIFVSMSKSTIIDVGIRDINGKPIETFTDVNAVVSPLKVTGYTWNYVPSDGTNNEYYLIRMKMSMPFNQDFMDIDPAGGIATTVVGTNANEVTLELSNAAAHLGKFQFVLDPQYTYDTTGAGYINEWRATVSTDPLANEILIKLEPTGAAPTATLFNDAQITGGTGTFSPNASRASLNYIPYTEGATDNAYITTVDNTMQLFRIVPFGTIIK